MEIKKRIKESSFGRILRRGKHKLQSYKSRICPQGADLLRVFYAKYYEECAIESNMILYEAYAGRGLVCNPYAIFKYFTQRDDFKNYIHVWVVERKEQKEQLEKVWKPENIHFVQRETEEYCKYLCQAKFLINNLSFPNYYTKKEGQIYINTWHGIPLKTLGFDIPDGRITGLNTIRNFLSVDVFLSPNRFMTERFQYAFQLEGVQEGYIMEAGMPRNDQLFHTNPKDILNCLKDAGVEVEDNKKIVLYAPTWKGEKYSNPDISTEAYFQVMEQVEKSLPKDEYQVLVKPHQIVYKHIVDKGLELTAKFIPATIDTNEILSVVDLLISDYSSIYFDYLVSEKPIVFYIPDLEDYQEQRGLYFGMEKLPGPIAQNLNELGELLKNIENIQKSYEEKYQKERLWACKNDDGMVCKRVVEKIMIQQDFSGLITFDASRKKKILMYSGDLQVEDVRTNATELLGQMDYEQWDVTLIVPHTGTDVVLNWIKNVEPKVRVLRSTGKMAVQKHQYGLVDALHHHLLQEKKYKKFQKEQLLQLCKRELRRVVGEMHFDYAVDLTGKSKYYQNLFDCMEDTEKISYEDIRNGKNVVCQKNDKELEYTNKCLD